MRLRVRLTLLYCCVVFLADQVVGLEVECSYYSQKNMISCRCIGPDRSTSGYEDLSGIINRYVHGRYRNMIFRHIKLSQCVNAKIYLDLRAFVVEGRVQNITDVSFDRLNELGLIINDIDYGNKRFVFENIGLLTLGGSLLNRRTRVDIYIRNRGAGSYASGYQKGDVIFQDFLAASFISLINIQNQNSVTIVDSAFENLNEVDLIRTGSCYVGLDQSQSVPCTKRDLFISTAVIGASWDQITKHPLFIGGLIFIILAIILALLACCYFKRNKDKRELELMGYPPSSTGATTISGASSQRPTVHYTKEPSKPPRKHASTSTANESRRAVSPQNCADYYKHKTSRTRQL